MESPDLHILKAYEASKELLDQERLSKQIEKIAVTVNESLGAGKTAEVFFLPEQNPKNCYKLISQERLNSLYEFAYDIPHYNSCEVEAEFLSELCTISDKVAIPHPQVIWEGKSDKLGDFQVLIMETLDAVTIQDVLLRAEDAPENFDYKSFMQTLKDFVEKMNSEYKIHHRDLSVTNVLIDKETGKPCIVDFGDAYKEFGEGDDPYQNGKFLSDKARLKEIEASLKAFAESTHIDKI